MSGHLALVGVAIIERVEITEFSEILGYSMLFI